MTDAPALGLCAVWLSLWSALIAGTQNAPGAMLPGPALRAHLTSERFAIVTSTTGLPLGVRDELRRLFGSASLDIAEPGAEFQAAASRAKPNLPRRRLAVAGCANDHHCLVYYERGGAAPTWHVALFQWSPAATRFEWGGRAPGGLATIEDVRKAILLGAIKDANGIW
ncbi:MAG TPA: hypothetical protein VFK57_10385 [Vicinamibacterales bacterium]|nr:hypothetical protein [Vicinamibacterales bacterium]